MMRLSLRSFGACAFACVAFPALSLALLGCARDGAASKGEPTDSTQTALQRDSTVTVPWGGGSGLSFIAGGKEDLTRGPQSIAFDASGSGYMVLDSLASRVVKVSSDGDVHAFAADLPKDADAIAVSPRGELAVHRALELQVFVYDARGSLSGKVPVPEGARDANIVHLLSQGRVMLEHPFQERYLLGSPNVPRQPETILPSRREGVASGFDKVGYQIVVRHPEGEIGNEDPAIARLGRGPARAGSHAYLLVLRPVGETDQGSLRYESKQIADLGEASSARIFGASNGRTCSVLEHVDMNASVVDVKREVVCHAVATGTEIARFAIDTSHLYTPRQDLVFNGKQVAHALPTEQGLSIRTVAVTEVSK